MEPGRREIPDLSESNATELAVSDLDRSGDQEFSLGTAATTAVIRSTSLRQ